MTLSWIKENTLLFDFSLSSENVQLLDDLKGCEWYSKDSDIFLF
jgi:hypothetical protein